MLLTTITIRFATPADASLIADLSRRTFYDSFAADNTKENMDKFMGERFTNELLMAEVGAPGNIFILAYRMGEIAGYARLRENNQPPELAGFSTLEVARIYALQEMIGKGVGKALMEKAIAIAREKAMQVVWLGVWEKNQRAIDFYTKSGFKKFGEHPFILGDDVQTDWMMRLDIKC
jgi:diamine N-acetyltransferase